MGLTDSERRSVYVASALIAIRLSRKNLELLIVFPKLWAIIGYSLTLPYATSINTYHRSITALLVCWLSLLLWLRLSRPIGRERIEHMDVSLDRAILFSLYQFLALASYREGSFLANSWLIRSLSQLASSKLSLAICLGAGLAIRRVTPSWTWNFAYFSALARLISDGSWLFLSALFFGVHDVFRRNSGFLRDVIKRWISTCLLCTVCQLLAGYTVKIVKGGDFWFPFEAFKYTMLWFIYRNTRDMWDDPRYRGSQASSEPNATYASYSYSPLPTTRHFRLLLLHARRPNSPVKASLIPFALDDAPRFEAMSYTWGGSDKCFKLLVDDKEIPVTANAYKLLQDKSSYLFPCLIWIDAICIDQNNVSEKTWQVRLMGDIYIKASLTTIWLSASTADESDSDEINDNFQGMLAFYQIRRFNAIDSRGIKEFNEGSPGNGVVNFGRDVEAPAWKAIAKLLHHSYFERSWIIQEIVLASCVRVMYRRLEIDWEVFVSGLAQMAKLNYFNAVLERHSGKITAPNFMLDNVIRLDMWRRTTQAKDAPSFNEIGLATRHFKATDLRDKIFAVHAVCQTEPSSERWTLPDYTMNLSDVYLNATRRLIEEQGICQILYLAGVGYSREPMLGLKNFPTWGVDWSRSSNFSPLSPLDPSVAYCAGGDSQPELKELHCVDDASLFLAVYLLDTIEQLGPLFSKALSNGVERYEHRAEDDPVFRQSLHESRQLVLQAVGSSGPYHQAERSEQAEEVFWRLLIGDRTSTERPAPSRLEKGYRLYVLEMNRLVDELDKRPISDDVPLRFSSATEYAKDVHRAATPRRVCVTKDGYVGLVPPHSVLGDIVVIVPGAQTPFVLRPLNGLMHVNKYQLVGECYIHGVMDGEALAHASVVKIIQMI